VIEAKLIILILENGFNLLIIPTDMLAKASKSRLDSF